MFNLGGYMKRSRFIVILFVLILTITGCSKSETTATQNATKGRYIESQITLPEEIDKEATIQLSKKNGMPFLYVIYNEEKPSITGYQFNSDGTWAESTPEWLKDTNLPIKNPYSVEVLEDGAGNGYLYYSESMEEGTKGNILRTKDGKTYEALAVEGWDKKDSEMGIYFAPDKVHVMEDGTIAAIFPRGEIKIYNKDDQKEIKNQENTIYCNTILNDVNNQLILGQIDPNYNMVSIDIIDIANKDNNTSYPIKSTLSNNYSYLDVDENKDLVLCNADGVHIMEKGGTLWQTIIDGTLTSLTMHSLWSTGFVAGSDNNYYILYNSTTEGYQFMKYAYDKTVDTIPSTELTIYSLKENPVLRQAAAVFQQKNKDVKVTVHIAMTNEEYEAADYTIKQDYIRALNTELLAGGGPDILVLDGLPADSFVEKGILTDMSDIVMPMVQKEELFPNMIEDYITDDKVYRVPTRFQLHLLFSRSINSEDIATIEDLAKYVESHKDTSLFGELTWNDLIDNFSPFLRNSIVEGKEVNKEALIKLLKELKAIGENSGILKESDQNEGKINIWDLASHCQVNFSEINGFGSSLFPFGIQKYVKGNSTPFENSFTPSGELGINKASSKQELCKDFISLALSEEVQKYDFYDGFSINTKANEYISQMDMSSYEASSEIENEDGSYTYIEFRSLNQEEIDKIMSICSTVSNRSVVDEVFISMFKEETKAFFEGTISAEAAADQLIKKTSTYFEE